MNVTVTGRHTSVSDRLKDYTEKKVVKLEKYFHQVFEIKVIFYPEKMDKVAEVLIFADGAQFHGLDKAGDFYSALDLLMDKLDKQVKKFKEKHQLHKGASLSEIPVVDISSENDERLHIIINEASAKPSDEIEAYLQLKVEGDYFRVYRKADKEHGYITSALYGANGKYHLAEATPDGAVTEFDFEIVKDSWTNPEIKKGSPAATQVKNMKLSDALDSLVSSDRWFLPFFNTDNNSMNVVYQSGKRVELMVLAEK